MGYWGYYIVAKSEGPLEELNSLSSVRARLELAEQFLSGWQAWEHPSEPEIEEAELAAALAQETRAPSMIGYVMDSDCVVIEAASPASGTWRACLGPQLMASYLSESGDRLQDWFLSPEEAASRAARWAREAGHSVDSELLVETFRADVSPAAQRRFGEFLYQIGLQES